MKKLLIAIILMMVGTSASAVVEEGDATCTGTFPDITCLKAVVCVNAPASKCDSTLVDSNLADCATSQGGKLIGALHTGGGATGAFCTWDVTDPTEALDPVSVTIDGSDGLPVELQSLSVE